MITLYRFKCGNVAKITNAKENGVGYWTNTNGDRITKGGHEFYAETIENLQAMMIRDIVCNITEEKIDKVEVTN